MTNARNIATPDYTTIPPELDGARLDAALAALRPEISRAAWKEKIARGEVKVDDETRDKPSRTVAAGEVVRAVVDETDSETPARSRTVPEDIPLAVVFEDAHILVANKPPGLAVHPGAGRDSGTFLNGLLRHYPPAAVLPRGGLVHRLDKDTSGLMVVAKNEHARRRLTDGFKTRTIGREYLAVVCGDPPQTGVVSVPLARSRKNIQKMAARFAGREATTRYAVEKKWPGFALLRCWLETGRTHQIRVHLEHAGFPLVGDRVYRRRAKQAPTNIRRQCLHATALRLAHPDTGEKMQWRMDPPDDFREVVSALDGLRLQNESPKVPGRKRRT